MCWDNPSRAIGTPSAVAASSIDFSHLLQWMPGYRLSQNLPSQVPPPSWPQVPSEAVPRAKSPRQLHNASVYPSQHLPGFPGFAVQRSEAPQQHSLHCAHVFALKQLRESSPFPGESVSSPSPSLGQAKPRRSSECLSAEPHPKRLAIDLNAAVEVAEEDEEEPYDATEHLPDECMAQVFSCLVDVRDRMSCAMVCRRWLHIASTSRKQKKPRIAVVAADVAQEVGKVACPAQSGLSNSIDVVSGLSRTLEGRSACDARLMAMAIALSDKGGLEKLVVRGNIKPADADLALHRGSLPLTASGFHAITLASPDLRAVAIWDCDWLDDEMVMVISRNCRKLEKLDILNCPKLTDRSMMALSRFCPCLSVFNLSSSRMITDQGLQVLAKGCKVMTSLSLANCPQVLGKGVGVLLGSCSRLSALKLAGGMGVTDEGFRFIGQNASRLVRLRLSQLRLLTEKGFKALGEVEGFRTLASLSVVSCAGLTSAALAVIGQGCGGLKSLGLVGCGNVSDEGLLALLQHAKGLEALSLQMLPGISNETARFALEFGKYLKSLNISNCAGVRDSVTGAADWAIRCHDLSTLKLSSCASVGDRCLSSMGKAAASLASLDLCGLPLAGNKGVLAFLTKSSKKLSSIDLSGCVQITDKSVVSIAERCGDSVRSLCLDGCTKVTDKGLRALARECTAIEDLDLSKCDVSDRGVKVLLAAVGHSLVNLSLAGCARITDKTVEEIMDACQSLSGLNLKNCTGLTKRAVDKLKQQAVNLFGPTCLFIDP